MNGFFTRIGTTEVVLEWCEPNIVLTTSYNNAILAVDVSGTGANTFQGVLLASLEPDTFQTVEAVLDFIVDMLNLESVAQGAGVTFEVLNTSPGVAGIGIQSGDPGVFRITLADQQAEESYLAQQLHIIKNNYSNVAYVDCPDLRPYRYIDFTSSQLTYNQDLKDTSTTLFARDVLCRWYFSWDNPPALDGYGFPILMGYTPFVARRLFNPPKQIKWDPAQPVGNLAFQLFGNNPYNPSNLPIAQQDAQTNWLMTLQISEV